MPKILAVDDSLALLGIITDTLTPDYEVIAACNGKEAIEKARSQMPDLIIMDVEMPVMNGLDATGIIKKDPKTRNIPILILTARDSNDQMIAGLDAGADDYLGKPFQQEVLKARIRAHLRTKALFEALEQFRRDQEIVLDVMRETTSTLNILSVLHTVTKKIANYLNLSRCSVIHVDEEKGHGLVMASSDAAEIGGHCIYLDKYPEINKVLETMETLVIENVDTDQLMAGIKVPLSYQSLMVVPMTFRDELIGTLLLRASKSGGGFTGREADLGRMIAASAANAIKNAFLHEGLEEKKRELEKANSRLLELDKLKSNFLAMAAHELRSPLGIISGYIELVLEGVAGPLSPKATSFLKMALDGSTNLSMTVEDILDLSVIESGKLSLNLRQEDMVKVVEHVLKFMSKTMEEKGINVNNANECKTAKAVFDRKKIEQVLINLLSNAAKFTSANGEIGVDIRKGDNEYTVVVSDTGCGISKEDLGIVFEEFYKGKSREKGSGLGLSICKRIVELHGGSIWVESREGKGSNFYFTIPKTNKASIN